MNRKGFDGLTIVALALFLFMGFNILRDVTDQPITARGAEISSITPPTVDPNQYPSGEEANFSAENAPAEPNQEEEKADPAAVAAPYDHYTVTQGPHGFSYGQMAVDLAAGKGKTIKSPINGVVTELYVDEYGNPTLIIENEDYKVTLMHGDYTVNQGDELKIGQPVGSESNHGYTTNMQGVPCLGRENCGYHTHLNIFDKRAGENVNPLDLLGN